MPDTPALDQDARTGDNPPEEATDSGQPETADVLVDGAESRTDSRSDDAAAEPTDLAALLVREGDIAGDYLERLLDIADFDGDIDLDVENDRAIVAVLGGSELKPLIGTRGSTLDALQELTRLAVQRETGVRSRLMLDVGGYRVDRKSELSALARRTADTVLENGEPQTLEPMNAFERKVVHDAISAIDGVRSDSEGEDPSRRVVVSADR